MATTDTQATPLAQEIATYNTHKSELLESAPGKIVVIQGNRIVGTFDTKAEAYRQAYQQLGYGPFLVRRIQDQQETYYVGGSAL